MFNFTGIGAVIDWSMSGHIIEKYGWKYAFYVVAIIFGIFILLQLLFVFDSPSKHPRIEENEKEMIIRKLNATAGSGKKVNFRLFLLAQFAILIDTMNSVVAVAPF